MATVHSTYPGDLRTEATHNQSGTKLVTDAPVDNQGRGEFFSPTDLVATALGSCMITIIGIACRAQGFSIDGASWEVTKVMADNPRRIGEIIVELTFPLNNYTDQQKRVIEHITKNCPVALSLHPDLKQTVRINYL
ncbi:MAG: OsmC family protein [Bacteroidetes bacterium]|nr:OsmC family protein [Bacteroidota bacterium]